MRYIEGREDHYTGEEDNGDSNGMAWETTSLLPTTSTERRREEYDCHVSRGNEEEEEDAAMFGIPRHRKRTVLVAVAVIVVSMILMAAANGRSSSNNNNSNNISTSKSRTFVVEPASLQSSSSSSSSSVMDPLHTNVNVLDASMIAHASIDSLMDRWDEFKEDFSRHVKAFVASATQNNNDNEHVNVTRLQNIEHDLKQLDSEREKEGRKFAALARKWWDQDEAAVAQDAAAAGQTLRNWWNTGQVWTANEAGDAAAHVGSWWSTAQDATQEKGQDAAQAVGTWWNATEHTTEQDAASAAHAVGTWWDSAEHATVDEATEMRDKEQAVQRNFATWWKQASADERAWWNHTVQQAQQMEETAADKEHVWWDQTVGDYWNRTQHAAADDWDRTENAVTTGWDRTENAVTTGWNRTEHAVTTGWDRTEHAVATGWNRTEHAGADDWDRTKHALADDWNRTEHAAANDWNRTEHAAANDWNITKSKEVLWWNATERWFHSHLREVDPDADDEMRQPLLYLNTSTAYSLLMNGYGWYDYSADFFALQSGFDAQINQAYCGVASSAALLNSLRSSAVNLTLPVDPSYKPYQYATQTNLLDHKCSRRHVIRHNETFDGVLTTPGGVSLLQIKALLQCYLPADTWQVNATQVDPAVISRDRFRQDITSALRNKHARVMINFNRAVLGQHGGGHFSPIASYSKEQDAFLIMDVAKYKYPPVWVSAGRLHASASTTDGCGDWDFPAGQDRLSRNELLLSYNPSRADYDEGLRELHCTTTFRGYIIVSPKRDN